jgi:predicted HicB family RNase H-like nuclease
MNIEHYSYHVSYSPGDGEFVGTCTEFPSLSWLDKNSDKAFAGIRALVATVVADLRAAGETPPEPLATRKFSGRFVLRMPAELHRALAVGAAEQGVSLNTYAVQRLARVEAELPTLHEGRAAYGARSAESMKAVSARKRVRDLPVSKEC